MRKLTRKLDIDVASIKMLVFDVDGVLTDNRMIYLKADQEAKAFNASDGFAIRCTAKTVFKFAVITARGSEVTIRRCEELGFEEIVSAWDKVSAIRELAKKHNLSLEEIGYVGNDVPDLVAMEVVGFAVCVGDAEEELLPASHYQTERHGGHGACREVINFILQAKGLDLVQIYRDSISNAETR